MQAQVNLDMITKNDACYVVECSSKKPLPLVGIEFDIKAAPAVASFEMI